MKDGRSRTGMWSFDPLFASVSVEPRPDVREKSPDGKAWAVLEVHPRNEQFYVGWSHAPDGRIEWYSEPVKTVNAMFAMGVEGGAATFHVRPVDGRTLLVMELVDVVPFDDERYADINHY